MSPQQRIQHAITGLGIGLLWLAIAIMALLTVALVVGVLVVAVRFVWSLA